jgi:alpha-L-rhamnosidase
LDTDPVVVDGGQLLAWNALGDVRRPDVMVAEQPLNPGSPTLSVAFAGGRTLAVRLHGLTLAGNPGVIPVHDPGRRTLLANPVAGGGPVVQLFSDYAEVTIPAGDTPCYVVLDFGRTLHARLSLVAEGPAGTIVDAGWDERLTAGRPLPNPGSLVSNLWSQVDSWVLDGTARQSTTLDTRSGRYLLLHVFGPGPVYFHQVQAMEETYPVDLVGSFASSDPLLDRIWQIGVDTLTPSMTDAYTDTPWRERGQWWSDALIAFHTNRAAFGDLALFRRGLRQVADAIDPEGHPAPLARNGVGMVMLDYGMQWVEGLSLYWRLSDDLALVEELYPAAQRLVGFLVTYEGSSGLLDIPPAHWSQSALVDWPAVSSRSGESAALNAQYAYTLRQMVDVAEAMGDHDQAQAYLSRGAAVPAGRSMISCSCPIRAAMLPAA